MLTVRVAYRPEDLLDDLLAQLNVPPDDPFAQEWISVPSLGFRSWLQLQLAQRLGASGRSDGIVANIDLPFPGSLRWTVLRAHSAYLGQVDQDDPWQVDRLVWSVLHVLSEPPSDLDPRLTRAKLPPGVALASRAGPIADLFDRYSVHRPDMLVAWRAGDDVGPDFQPLDDERLWQPRLFRAVCTHIAVRHGVTDTPSERLVDALGLIRSGDLAVDQAPAGVLPRRMFVFGPSVVPADMGPILDALGVHREVAAFLLSPAASVSHRLSQSVAARHHGQPGRASWAFPRSNPQAVIDVEHPLLASWAIRPLESAVLLGAGGVVPELVKAGDRGPETLLGQVQADLEAGSVSENAWSGRAGDGSIRIHRAPGPTRQVEVLRDVILGLLRDRPDLTESDIAVVCPQLDLYAPVLGAVFGPSAQRADQPHAGVVPALRYTVIDRNARSLNPVLDAMAKLLDVLPGRFDLGSVGELLYATAVRERFGLTGTDLALLSDWVDQACIRWGLDGAQRERWGINPDYQSNSWSAGIDQLMMGVALGDDLRDAPLPGGDPTVSATWSHALSVGGIAPVLLGEGDIGSAGRLAAALRSLAHVHQLLQNAESRTPQAWCQDLRTAADLMVASQRFEDWQRARFDAALDALLAASSGPDGDASDIPITYGDLRRLLVPALEGSRARADMGYGSVVVARPSLLVGVPFRVVCVLGLDQDALPGGASSGDDLAHVVPFVGDRDPRSEARAELLAALGSARDHLVITCTSTDVRTNAPVPDSVLLDELIDLLSITMGLSVEELREPEVGVVRTHPRQAFDRRNFISDGPAPFSFDPTALAGASALASAENQPVAQKELLAGPLEPAGDPAMSIELSELLWFFAHPVKAFFKNRLNVTVPKVSEESEAQLPTSLGPLDIAEVGSNLLKVGLELASPDDVVVDPETGGAVAPVQAVIDGYRARGLLPPPASSQPEIVEISLEVSAMLAMAERYDVRRPALIAHPVDLLLPSGIRLVGSVNGC
ncbi:MAG: exodeoxyribonuclease V subunit gamma, partial [Actinomycetes bacterium]